MDENNVKGVEDLAQNEKFKEEEEQEQVQENSRLDETILKQTAGVKFGESITIMNTLDLVGMGQGQAKLMLGDTVLGIVQDGKIQYTNNAKTPEVEQMLKQLNEELELKQQLEQKQKENDTGEREEDKQPETIKDDNEKPEEKPEQGKEEPEKPEIERDSSWIEIKSDREIDEMRTFIGAIKKEHPELGEINRAFIAPDKNNPNSYKLYVQGKQGKITEVPLEATEGVNPMHEQVTTIQNDGTKATKKTPIQLLKINNRNMIAIFNGGRTTTSIHIANRTDGDNYTSTEISRADSQNRLHDPNEEVKEQVSSAEGQQQEGDEQERAYAIIKNFEKQGVPDKINPEKDQNGIEVNELDDFPTALVDGLKDSLYNTFRDKNITVSKEAIEKMAESIVDGNDFKDAVIEGMKVEEGAGRIPPDSAERVGSNISDSITNDEGLEDPGQENDGPQPGGRRRG